MQANTETSRSSAKARAATTMSIHSVEKCPLAISGTYVTVLAGGQLSKSKSKSPEANLTGGYCHTLPVKC